MPSSRPFYGSVFLLGPSISCFLPYAQASLTLTTLMGFLDM